MERTKNMPAVALTLDVSKVSGWLNDDACCRVERRAHLTMWGEVCGTGGGSAYGAVPAQAVCTGKRPD